MPAMFPWRALPRAVSFLTIAILGAQTSLPPPPAPQRVPAPAAATAAPYAPQAILPGGVVVPLYPAGSPFLNAGKVNEAEVYNMSQAVPARINSIVSIHNPSIEFHPVDRSLNTGAAIILAAGGGHNTLNVGAEAADFVPFFYNYGVNTVILRNRLRRDGYNPRVDAVNDALQAIRLVRAYAKEWNLDPRKIGIMGFSAGAELSAPSAVLFDTFDKENAGTPGLRGHYLPRAIAVRAWTHGAGDSARHAAGLDHVRGSGRPDSRLMGGGLLHGDVERRRAQRGDDALWARSASRPDTAGRQPHDGWIDGPGRHSHWHMAVPVHRLVPRPGLSGKAGRGDESRPRHGPFLDRGASAALWRGRPVSTGCAGGAETVRAGASGTWRPGTTGPGSPRCCQTPVRCSGSRRW